MMLRGKVAVVTGGGGGVGLAMVHMFAEQGAHVIAADTAADALGRLADIDGVRSLQVDVTRQADVDCMVDAAVKAHGRLDVLCNNAGVMDRLMPVAETPDEMWDRVLAVNLTGPFLACRRAIPVMLEAGGGVIVNISSVAGLTGGRAGVAYTVSKHGLIGLTKNIAATYGGSGIRALTVCPGGVNTPLGVGGVPSELGVTMLQRSLPSFPRFGEPAEIANVVAFAASEKASFLNGAVILADGGWLAH